MQWLGYTIFRESWLMFVGECVSLNSPSTNWKLCHVNVLGVLPNIGGC